MNRYDYKCPECGIVEEHMHSMKDDPEIKCSNCDTVMERQIGLGGGFSIRGGSASIHWKEKRNRLKKREELGPKQQERYGHMAPKPAPNVGGERCDSWSDAQKLAKSKGLNTDSYKPMVEKEKKEKKPKIYTGPGK